MAYLVDDMVQGLSLHPPGRQPAGTVEDGNQHIRDIRCLWPWHGANWTFIIWGVVHAVAFVPLLLLGTNRRHVREPIAEGRLFPSFADVLGMLVTFFVVMFGWAFFRADSVGQSFMWIREILFGFDVSVKPMLGHGVPHAVFWSSVMLLCEWVNRKCDFGFSKYPKKDSVRYLVYWLIMIIIVLNLSPRQTFVYFQF